MHGRRLFGDKQYARLGHDLDCFVENVVFGKVVVRVHAHRHLVIALGQFPRDFLHRVCCRLVNERLAIHRDLHVHRVLAANLVDDDGERVIHIRHGLARAQDGDANILLLRRQRDCVDGRIELARKQGNVAEVRAIIAVAVRHEQNALAGLKTAQDCVAELGALACRDGLGLHIQALFQLFRKLGRDLLEQIHAGRVVHKQLDERVALDDFFVLDVRRGERDAQEQNDERARNAHHFPRHALLLHDIGVFLELDEILFDEPERKQDERDGEQDDKRVLEVVVGQLDERRDAHMIPRTLT